MQQFIYPAIFYIDEEETKVYFPDLDISVSGDNYDEAYLFAKELLKKYFLYVIKNELDFNFPSSFENVKSKCSSKEIPLLVDAIITSADVRAFKKS